MKILAAALAATFALAATKASAQYYAPAYPPPPPPPGYYPPPPPPPPPRHRLGGRCEVRFTDAYGNWRRQICPIIEPKPVGMRCACPGPGPGGYVGGVTIP